jgi:hypothetical protein
LEIAALPSVEPIARPTVDAFFGAKRRFVGSDAVEFSSRDFAASDARADTGGLPMLSGIDASRACSVTVVAIGRKSRHREDDPNRCCRDISTDHTLLLPSLNNG